VRKKLNLKKILKKIKLAESSISTLFGFIVVLIVGSLIFKYFQGAGKTNLSVVNNDIANEEEQALANLAEGEKIHEIQEGESLWTIAEKYYGSGYNWVDIAKVNNLVDPNLLANGIKLIIPAVEKKMATVKEADSAIITGNQYTVVKGDSLWSIAVRAYGDGYRWQELAKANNLKNPGLIHPGNVFTIPR